MSSQIEIVGPSYDGLKRKTEIYARNGFPMLFQGPTGVGKELFARLYARAAERELIPVHFAALTHGTIESQLFGHKKGSFTGADHDEIGLIRSAEGKVLFLDEIGLAPRDVQANLLRVVEYGDYRPLGESKLRAVKNVRFAAATSKPESVDLALRQRFHTLEIHPPQDWDLLELIRHYFSKFRFIRYIREGALVRLHFYTWPGNTREIKTVISETVANSQAACESCLDTVEVHHLPRRLLDIRFSAEGRRYSEGVNRVSIDEVRDWIWKNFPFTVELHRERIIEDGSPCREPRDAPPQETAVKKGQKKVVRASWEDENPFTIISKLPRARALEESEKVYYLVNASDPRITTQKELAKKMQMNESYLSRRLKRFGIQNQVKRRLLGQP